MSRPKKFLTASAEELLEHAGVARTLAGMCAYIRDEVAREVREECEKDLESLRADNLRLLMERVDILARAERAERELADAKRQGAWEALTKLANETIPDMPSRYVTSADTIRVRDTHYAPSAPAKVHGFAIEVRGDAPDDKVVVTKDGKPVFTITLADREGKGNA